MSSKPRKKLQKRKTPDYSQAIGVVLLQRSKTLAWCLICGASFSKPQKCAAEHCKGYRHISNVTSMKYNGIRYKNGFLHCRVCSEVLDVEDHVQHHIETGKHRSWIADMEKLTRDQFIDYSGYLSHRSYYANCSLCYRNIDCDLEHIKEHINDLSHKEHHLKWLRENNAMEPKEDGLWCKVCNVSLKDDFDILFKHLQVEIGHDCHEQRVMNLEDLVQDQGIDLNSFFTVPDEYKAHCKRCDLKMLCNLVHLECHLHSECHEYRTI